MSWQWSYELEFCRHPLCPSAFYRTRSQQISLQTCSLHFPELISIHKAFYIYFLSVSAKESCSHSLLKIYRRVHLVRSCRAPVTVTNSFTSLIEINWSSLSQSFYAKHPLQVGPPAVPSTTHSETKGHKKPVI